MKRDRECLYKIFLLAVSYHLEGQKAENEQFHGGAVSISNSTPRTISDLGDFYGAHWYLGTCRIPLLAVRILCLFGISHGP